MNMKWLNEWAKRKPLGLVRVAQQLAVSVEACFEFLKMIKSGEKKMELFQNFNSQALLRLSFSTPANPLLVTPNRRAAYLLPKKRF